MDLYNKYLKQIESQIGTGATDNFTLESTCKKLFGKSFKGVYSADDIPKLTKTKNKMIYNLDKSGSVGTHWCSIFKDKDTGISYSYDSFARNLKKDRAFKNLSKGKRLILKQAGDQKPEQHVQEMNCGARSIAWLMCCNDVENDKLNLKKLLSI